MLCAVWNWHLQMLHFLSSFYNAELQFNQIEKKPNSLLSTFLYGSSSCHTVEKSSPKWFLFIQAVIFSDLWNMQLVFIILKVSLRSPTFFSLFWSWWGVRWHSNPFHTFLFSRALMDGSHVAPCKWCGFFNNDNFSLKGLLPYCSIHVCHQFALSDHVYLIFSHHGSVSNNLQ